MSKKVLMICLGKNTNHFLMTWKKYHWLISGNICRSPIAEGVFQETIDKAGLSGSWEVDSAAIGGWHVGNSPDHRALSTMKKHGIKYTNRARQITKQDFNDFDYIFGMDTENMADLKRLAPKGSKAKCLMLGDFGLDKNDRIIEDPYYVRFFFK